MFLLDKVYSYVSWRLRKLHWSLTRSIFLPLSAGTRGPLTANCERNEAKQTNLASALTTLGLGE